MAAWVRDVFKPKIEVVAAPPSTAKPREVKRSLLVDGLQPAEAVSEEIALGRDLFGVTLDESLLRTLSSEIRLSVVLEVHERGVLVKDYPQRLKMGLKMHPIAASMSEKPLYNNEWVADRPSWASAFQSESVASETVSSWSLLLATLGEMPKTVFNPEILCYGRHVLAGKSSPDRVTIRLASMALAAECLVSGTDSQLIIRSSVPPTNCNVSAYAGFAHAMEKEMSGAVVIPAFLASENQFGGMCSFEPGRWWDANS